MKPFLAGSILVAASALAKAAETPLVLLRIQTVSDYLEICESLERGTADTSDDVLTATACESYTQGVLHGYAGTLSLLTEAQVAGEAGLSLEEAGRRIESDAELHKNATERVSRKAFVCARDAGSVASVVRKIYPYLLKEIEPDARAYYAVLTAMRRMYPCGE